MNRRTFLTSSVGLSTGAAALGGDPGTSTEAIAVPEKLAGKTLEELRGLYRDALFEDFLPFMDRHVIDHEEGGFCCHTDRRGNNLSRNKNSWYEGRGIWVYSYLFNRFGGDEKHLEVARKAVAFIERSRPSQPGELWPRRLLPNGRPLSTPDDSIYGTMFIAEGFAEYSIAAGKPEYWDEAKRLALICQSRYDAADYLPAIGKTYLGESAPPFPGARILGHWMVFLRLATQMLRHREDPEIEGIADRCVQAIIEAHHHPDFDLTNELVNHDLSRPDNDYAQLVYTGHAIETYWMLMDEAVRREDDALYREAFRRFVRHFTVAWDDVYGGVFRNLWHVEENRWSVDKVLWAQEEPLIGSLLSLTVSPRPEGIEIFERLFPYVWEKYPLKNQGFPLWVFSTDRRVSYTEKATRVENFHHPRHLMMALEFLTDLQPQNG
jgi:mannose/cellobiose epimerase-like protein (N-acyl-D-glucosamine 2-epimerase family)